MKVYKRQRCWIAPKLQSFKVPSRAIFLSILALIPPHLVESFLARPPLKYDWNALTCLGSCSIQRTGKGINLSSVPFIPSKSYNCQASAPMFAKVSKDEYDDDGEYSYDDSNLYEGKMKKESEEDEDDYDDYDYEDYLDEDDFFMDDDFYDDEEQEQDDQNIFEWESYKGADILLPPLLQNPSETKTNSPTSPSNTPTAIIHFIGGTFVGALPPRVAYRSFLEGLAQYHGNLVIIATSLPIAENSGNRRYKNQESASSPFNLPTVLSPLDHWQQVRIIRRNLHQSIRYVLYDEYEDPNLVDNIPIIGIGHSLGGRLQVLLHTKPNLLDDQTPKIYDKKRNSQRRNVIGNVLISFNNWNAQRSIPLLEEAKGLWNTSRDLGERLFQFIIGDDMDDDYDYDYDDDDFEEGTRRRSGRRERELEKDQNNHRNEDWNDEDDEVYQSRRQDRRQKSQERRYRNESTGNKVTKNKLFEFYPSPETLWSIIRRSSFPPQTSSTVNQQQHQKEKEISIDINNKEELEFEQKMNRSRREKKDSPPVYSVPRNLFIQFEDDELDQSSEIARRLMEASSESPTSASAVHENVEQILDLKFARLKGNHLTPCASPGDNPLFSGSNEDLYEKRNNQEDRENMKDETKSNNTNFIARKQIRRNQELTDLITSVASYVDYLVEEEQTKVKPVSVDFKKEKIG